MNAGENTIRKIARFKKNIRAGKTLRWAAGEEWMLDMARKQIAEENEKEAKSIDQERKRRIAAQTRRPAPVLTEDQLRSEVDWLYKLYFPT
jgi:hypothetical protein